MSKLLCNVLKISGGGKRPKSPLVAGLTSTDPLPYTAATCVLSNSTYKLSISTDMTVETQVTKLRAKLLTESHWR